MKFLFKSFALLLLLPSLAFGGSSLTSRSNSIKYNVTDGFVAEVPISAFGDSRTIELSPVFQYSFEYTVDNTRLTDNTVTGTGTVTQAQAMAVIGTGTTTASTALLESVAHLRYRSGFGASARFTALFTTCTANTVQYIGLADVAGSSAVFKNGFTIGCDGTTFGFHRFQNDVKISIPLADWDDILDGEGPSGIEIDITKLNIFFITFEYLGAGNITIWLADDKSRNMVPVHTIDYTNSNIIPSVFNPNFHFVLWADNGSTTADIILKTGSFSTFIEGDTAFTELQQPLFGTGKKQKTSVTSSIPIFSIRNKDTYSSTENFIDINVLSVFTSIEAGTPNNLGEVNIILNGTLTGTPVYSDINTTDSVIEIDTSATGITGGQMLITIPLAGRNDKAFPNFVEQELILRQGDVLTFTGSSDNSATINAGASWKELF